MKPIMKCLLGLCVIITILPSTSLAGSISGIVTGPDAITGLENIWAIAWQWTGTEWDLIEFDWTDATGNYTIDGLSAGIYRVEFNDQGGNYIGEVYNNATNLSNGTDITVTASGAVTNINASLMAAAVTHGISGRITMLDGVTPIDNIRAEAYELTEFGWGSVASAISDANGNYTINGLDAGTYRVQFTDWWNGIYESEVYDDTYDVTTGTDIIVPAGTLITGINAMLGFPAPVTVVVIRSIELNSYEILFTGATGQDYILQETASLTNEFENVGSLITCRQGTNIFTRPQAATAAFWRIKRFP